MILGQDTCYKIIFRGYLFPLGQCVDLLRIIRRGFRRDVETRAVVPYVEERLFIIVCRFVKPNQKITRFFPSYDPLANNPLLLTNKTPDLYDPLKGKILVAAPKYTTTIFDGRLIYPHTKCLIFWPHKAGVAKEVFNFTLSFNEEEIKIPLLCIDSIAANDEVILKDLSEYYDMTLHNNRRQLYNVLCTWNMFFVGLGMNRK